jgi:hypothetical protein
MNRNAAKLPVLLSSITLMVVVVAFAFLFLTMSTIFDIRHNQTVEVESIKQMTDLTTLKGIATRNVIVLCEISFIAKMLAALLFVTGALTLGTILIGRRRKVASQ